MPNAFVDTNIFVYAADETTPYPEKPRLPGRFCCYPICIIPFKFSMNSLPPHVIPTNSICPESGNADGSRAGSCALLAA